MEELQLPEDINNQTGRPKGVVTWRLIMREAFWYLEHAPEKLEDRLALPRGTLEHYRKRDLQMFFVLKQIEDIGNQGLTPVERAALLDKLIDRMDGKPNQPIELGGEVATNLIDIERLPITLQRKYLRDQTERIRKMDTADTETRRKQSERKNKRKGNK